MSELIALAERVEAATGPDRNLDMMIHGRDGPDGIGAYGDHPAYTASLDAAMTLIPSGMILRRYMATRFVPHGCEVGLDWAHGGWIGESDHSFALALTAACLRAHDSAKGG